MDPKLYKAAKEGNVRLFLRIYGRNLTEEEAMRIEEGIFLNRTQHGNNNILHIAARAGRDTFVAEALRRFPFLSEQVNSQGDTPLLVAARFGHLQVVKTLAEPNNELPMQDDTATAVESGTNSRSSRRQSDVEEGLVDHQLEQGTVQDNVATVENGTNSSNISRRQRDVKEGLLDDQLEQATSLENGTNLRDMTTALENETNSSSSRRPRDVEEGLDDHQLEQGTIQDGMATAVENGTNSRCMATALENETNLSSSRRPRDVEEGLDDYQLEAGTIQDGMATAVENGTISRDMATVLENVTNSSSRHPRDVEEGLDDHQLEQDTIQDNVTTVENGTNSSNISRRQKDVEGLPDDQLEQATAVENGTNSRDMATTPENETNSSSSSHRQRDVEKVLVDRQLIYGTTALHEALRNGHEEVALYLLKLDPKMATLVTGAGESPLFLAAESRCESFMSDILESNRSYSTKGPDGLNVLHAARDCSVRIISILIRRRPDLMRQRDDHGKAAIHYAVEADYWDLVHEILKADASIALFPDNDGDTPLLGAASSGRRYFCRDILKICPESIEARNHEGRHALHLCKLRDVCFLMRIPEILELLNEGDEEGNTPLHLAIKENDYGKAMLLASSASIELGAVNKEGLTALDLCQTDWKNIFQQRLMWLHLATRGAPRGRRPIEYKFHAGERVADYKPLINTMALVATLIATVTFAAAFTMPGGYDTSPDNLGVANLVKIAALKAFIVSDTIAMSCSITAVLTLALSVNGGRELQRRICIMSWVLVGLAMRGTLVAFMCGIFVVIAPKTLWVAIFVCIICGIASVAVELSVPILFSPTIIAIIRYRMQQRRYRMQQRRKAMRQIEQPGFVMVCTTSSRMTTRRKLLRKLAI